VLFGNFSAEAQAGDGTQADPTPAWIVSAGLLSRLKLAAHATSAHFFNTPRTFVTGATRATPVAQQRNPARYYELAAQAAHEHGLLFIAAPQTSLVARLAPATPAPDRDAEFLRLRLARDTARHADAFVTPAQPSQDDSSAFASFVNSASRQAARSHPGIELLAGLSAGAARPGVSPTDLFDAFLSTRLTVSGYGLVAPASAATTAGVGFLHKIERLK